MHAIPGRPGIAPPVTDFVVTRGDEKTERSLAANKGAQFSKMGMRTLIAKAAKDVDLRALIVECIDLSIAAIGKLLPLISQELARRMHGIPIDFDESEMSHYVVDWMNDRGGNLARVARFIDSIRKGDLVLEDVVRELIRAEHLLDTASVIAATTDLDWLYACDVLMRGKQEAALLLLTARNCHGQRSPHS